MAYRKVSRHRSGSLDVNLDFYNSTTTHPMEISANIHSSNQYRSSDNILRKLPNSPKTSRTSKPEEELATAFYHRPVQNRPSNQRRHSEFLVSPRNLEEFRKYSTLERQM